MQVPSVLSEMEPSLTVSFTVFGLSAPAGSKTSGVSKAGVRFVRDSNPRSAQWKTDVAQAAGKFMGEMPPLEGPLVLELDFYRPRPKSHFKADGYTLSATGRRMLYPTGRPDSTKLTRAVEDAMTGIVYRDDSQIVHQIISKRFGTSRVEVKVTPIDEY